MSNIFGNYSLSNEPVSIYTHDGGVIASIFIALLSFIFTCLVNGLASNGPNSKWKLNDYW
jgi:predicted membrane channel-forming protein YqfA (hemolysin III family)